MTKAALLVTVLAACATDGIEADHPTPTTPIEATVTSRVGDRALVAAGGVMSVRIEDKTAIGLEGNASPGFEVSPFELDRWPNTISPEYWVRANVAGTGSYEIVTSKGIATGLVHSADLVRVALVPAHYELAAPVFAVTANRPEVQVALFDAQGHRLVDASVSISSSQTAWDTARLTTEGHHTLVVDANSFAERSFEIDVVLAPERIESVRVGDRTCFHAYTGDTEIAVAMTFDGGTRDPDAHNCATAIEGAALRMRL